MERAELQRFLGVDSPLGPLMSEAIHNTALFHLLNEENPASYKFVKTDPPIVVGRRGSGKTGYLMNLSLEKRFSIAEFIKPGPAFERIVEKITITSENYSISTVETVSEYWTTVICLCALRSIVDEDNHIDSLYAKFAQQYGRIKTDIASFLLQLYDRTGGGIDGDKLPGHLVQALLRGICTDCDELKELVEKRLDEQNKTCVILIDTLEDPKLYDERYKSAMQGLLKSAGKFNQSGQRLQVRAAAPGEMFRHLRQYSSNIIKDMSNIGVLQWHAGDLLSVAAQRYACYLYAHDIGGIESLENKIKQLSDRKNSIAFFESILPPVITNAFGQHERTLAFILRHTQLIPRHIILYMQEIIAVSKARNQSPAKVDEFTVKVALKRIESIVTKEICQAFEFQYDNTDELARFLKHVMPRTFKDSDFRANFQRHRASFDIPKIMTANQALQTLIHMGAVGRRFKETELYHVAKFEYVGNADVNYGPDDTLCVHPIFNGKPMDEIDASKPLEGKPIYPFGSDPDEDIQNSFLL